LIEGEKSGKPKRFDANAFKRRLRRRMAEYRLSPAAERDLGAFGNTLAQSGD